MVVTSQAQKELGSLTSSWSLVQRYTSEVRHANGALQMLRAVQEQREVNAEAVQSLMQQLRPLEEAEQRELRRMRSTPIALDGEEDDETSPTGATAVEIQRCVGGAW